MFANPKYDEALSYLIIGGSASGKSVMSKFFQGIFADRCGYIQRWATPIGISEMLMFCDSGWCVVDEFDKFPKQSRNIFLECMSDRTVTAHTHKQHIQRNARTNIIALCNPTQPELIEEIPLTEQLSFSGDFYLLNRFSFIIPVYPPMSGLYPEIAKKYLSKEDLGKYYSKFREIAIERRMNIPKVNIDRDLREKVGLYVQLLKDMNPNKQILIGPRLINGIYAAMQARSRMSGRGNAKKEDLEYVQKIMKEIGLDGY